MKHEIDLKNYQIRTDLAIDSIENNNNLLGVKQDSYCINDIKVTNVLLDNDNNLGKVEGSYITIEFNDITDRDNRINVENVLIDEIKKMLNKMNINKDDSCLIIGLGNIKSTPDSLGPLTIDNIIVTNHLFMMHSLDDNFRRVSAINPGVTGQTGIETSDIILSVVKSIKPDFIIISPATKA